MYIYEVAYIQGRIAIRFGADAQYSSKYLGLLGRRRDFFQDAFAKLNANVAVGAADESWELSFIANNLTNKLTISGGITTNYAGGVFFPGSILGGPTDGPAGEDELIGFVDRGRELWVRLTLRPATLFGGD